MARNERAETEPGPATTRRALAFAGRIVREPSRTTNDRTIALRFAQDSGASTVEIAAAVGWSEEEVTQALSAR